jgi:hypothetical protein
MTKNYVEIEIGAHTFIDKKIPCSFKNISTNSSSISLNKDTSERKFIVVVFDDYQAYLQQPETVQNVNWININNKLA